MASFVPADGSSEQRKVATFAVAAGAKKLENRNSKAPSPYSALLPNIAGTQRGGAIRTGRGGAASQELGGEGEECRT